MTRLVRHPARLTHPPAPAAAAPAPRATAAPAPRACPACGGTHVRVIRKSTCDPVRSSPAVGVCQDCAHFWAEADPIARAPRPQPAAV